MKEEKKVIQKRNLSTFMYNMQNYQAFEVNTKNALNSFGPFCLTGDHSLLLLNDINVVIKEKYDVNNISFIS